MKKVFTMVIILALAVVVYIGGCNIMDDMITAIEPDYIGYCSQQPNFTNTVRSW